MPIIFTTTASVANSTYSSDDDLDAAFGVDNVDKWADLNNNDDASEITTRRLWAREQAYARINARLRFGPYAIPFEAVVDPVIVKMEAALAGAYLYEGRSITDQEDGSSVNQLAYVRKAFDADVRDILSRRLRLDVSSPVDSFPQAVAAEEVEGEQVG